MRTKAGRSFLQHLLASRLTQWLATTVILSAVLLASNVYLVHRVWPVETHDSDNEKKPKAAAAVPAPTSKIKAPVLWVYHDTVSIFD